MANLKDAAVSGETITLDNTAVHTLGPALVLEGCTILSDTGAKGLVQTGLSMKGGVWRQSRALKDFHFDGTLFEGVAFEGVFEGVDFGSWDGTPEAGVKACDFRRATLSACRFLTVEPDDVAPPNWPGFVIVHPERALDHVRGMGVTGKLATSLDIACDTDPECTIYADNLERLAERAGIDADTVAGLVGSVPGLKIGAKV